MVTSPHHFFYNDAGDRFNINQGTVDAIDDWVSVASRETDVRIENICGVDVVRGIVDGVPEEDIIRGTNRVIDELPWRENPDPTDSIEVESSRVEDRSVDTSPTASGLINDYNAPARFVREYNADYLTPETINNARENIRQVAIHEALHHVVSGGSYSSYISGGNNDMYGGCEKCYYYSMLFGGAVGDRTISSEEEFEVVKGEFVKHFNEKHHELYRKRKEKTGNRKTYKKMKGREAYGTSMFHTLDAGRYAVHVTGGFSFSSTPRTSPDTLQWFVNHERVGIDEANHNHIGSREPEYQIRQDPNPNIMDRQTRFRHQLLGRFRD